MRIPPKIPKAAEAPVSKKNMQLFTLNLNVP
jgi:hypothetical protein